MRDDRVGQEPETTKNPGLSEGALSRRGLVAALGAGALALGSRTALAQSAPPVPPSTITSPPRDFAPGAPPTTYFTDPDIITVDPLFNQYVQVNSAIERLWTGALWSEGPAWSAVGRYLVWSDIPNNRQLRWLEDDGRVSVFRLPSNNSNGNSFDYQGRQLSCEHLMRRVVRYELDGSVTVLADSFEGKRLNSPNDIVQHPDGGYWFTDPPYGGQIYEGAPDAPGGASNAAGRLKSRVGQPAGIGEWQRELPTNCYRIDPSGRIDLVVSEDQLPDPNGLCFSPDYKKLYVASTGKGPGDAGPGGKGEIHVFDVGPDNKLSGQKLFSDFMIDGVKCGPDGLRCDVDGNLWVSSNAGRAVGYNGVTAWTPEGKLMGRIRLPEVCGNLCFGGPSATACSWPRASRCMRSISARRERHRPEAADAARASLAATLALAGIRPYILALGRRARMVASAAQQLSAHDAPRRRAERLEARITAEQKALIERAAALQGRSVTDFVVTSVQEAAKRAIEDYEVIHLSVRDSKTFVEALLNPGEPGPKLREAAAWYRQVMGEEA